MSENKQDTINVELPIKARGDWVYVSSDWAASRERWREIAAGEWGYAVSATRTIAPAVVEWIERDEWEPLPIPDVGRKIQATLRDGRVVTLDVHRIDRCFSYVGVETCGALHFIESEPDGAAANHPRTITAWEYVDEFKPLDVPVVGRRIKATLRDGTVKTFEVERVHDIGSRWVQVIAKDPYFYYFIELKSDPHKRHPDDIVDWEYVDDTPKFEAGDWVLVGEDPDVVHAAWGQVGWVADPLETATPYKVRFPSEWHQIVEEEYLTPASPKDADWRVGNTVPAGTSIGREWVGESVVTGHRSLFGVSDSRTATTDRKIVWLGEFNG